MPGVTIFEGERYEERLKQRESVVYTPGDDDAWNKVKKEGIGGFLLGVTMHQSEVVE